MYLDLTTMAGNGDVYFLGHKRSHLGVEITSATLFLGLECLSISVDAVRLHYRDCLGGMPKIIAYNGLNANF